MLGTLVNAVGIAMGGVAGMLVKGRLTEKYRIIMLQAVGMSVLFIGLSGALDKLILPETHPILFIVSMVIGGIAGTWIDIEGRLKSLGDFLESRASRKMQGKRGNSVSEGFVKASLLFCIGTMAILGSIQSGTEGNHSILFAKSALDAVSSVIFASTMGFGVLLSAVSVLIYQGSLTLLSGIIKPYLTDDMLREMSIVGGILITVLGLDMLEIKKIKAGNLLPAILVPVIYYLVF